MGMSRFETLADAARKIHEFVAADLMADGFISEAADLGMETDPAEEKGHELRMAISFSARDYRISEVVYCGAGGEDYSFPTVGPNSIREVAKRAAFSLRHAYAAAYATG